MTSSNFKNLIHSNKFRGWMATTDKAPYGSFNQAKPETLVTHEEVAKIRNTEPAIVSQKSYEQYKLVWIDVDGVLEDNPEAKRVAEALRTIFPDSYRLASRSHKGFHIPVIIEDKKIPFNGDKQNIKINPQDPEAKSPGIEVFIKSNHYIIIDAQREVDENKDVWITTAEDLERRVEAFKILIGSYNPNPNYQPKYTDNEIFGTPKERYQELTELYQKIKDKFPDHKPTMERKSGDRTFIRMFCVSMKQSSGNPGLCICVKQDGLLWVLCHSCKDTSSDYHQKIVQELQKHIPEARTRGKSCGESGGMNKNGTSCKSTEGEQYFNSTEKVNLDKDGRCKYHPIDRFIESVIHEFASIGSIIFTEHEGYMKFYVLRSGMWWAMDSDFGLNSIRNKSLRHKSISKKELTETAKEIAEEGVIPQDQEQNFNQRNGYYIPYRVPQGIKVIEFDHTQRDSDSSDMFLSNIPLLKQRHTGGDDSQMRKLCASFPPEMWRIVAELFHPPSKKGSILVGQSNTGKSELFALLRLLFEGNGVAPLNVKALNQDRFNPVSIAMCENLVCYIDEADKEEDVKWNTLFDFLGRDVLSVEKKGENPVTRRIMGNIVFISNLSLPGMYIETTEEKNRFGIGDVVVIGKPNFSDLIEKYQRKSDKRKLLLPLEIFVEACNYLSSLIANQEYEKPFGDLDKLQWDRKKRELRSEPNLAYLRDFLFEKLKESLQPKELTDKNRVDYDFYQKGIDLATIAKTNANYYPKWIQELVGSVENEEDEEEEVKEIEEVSLTQDDIPLPE